MTTGRINQIGPPISLPEIGFRKHALRPSKGCEGCPGLIYFCFLSAPPVTVTEPVVEATEIRTTRETWAWSLLAADPRPFFKGTADREVGVADDREFEGG